MRWLWMLASIIAVVTSLTASQARARRVNSCGSSATSFTKITDIVSKLNGPSIFSEMGAATSTMKAPSHLLRPSAGASRKSRRRNARWAATPMVVAAAVAAAVLQA